MYLKIFIIVVQIIIQEKKIKYYMYTNFIKVTVCISVQKYYLILILVIFYKIKVINKAITCFEINILELWWY